MKFRGFSLPKITFWRVMVALFLILGAYALFVRYTQGLGPASHMTDLFPWGLWIGFDILCGVGLAAGGFTVCAVVYIFHIERFRPIIRPTVLTAFLGYSLVIVALMVDLGRPYRIWHALVFWNPHSVMFEVAWCVMLYTTVLSLEFAPIIFEKFGMKRSMKIMHSISIPVVILGVILSTLHQSSLGSLYLIMPSKLHPLWYTPILPVLFFISAVAVGLCMTIFESYLSHRAFRQELESDLLADIGKIAAVVLAVLLVVRLQDIYTRGAVHFLFERTQEAALYWLELLLGIVAPMILFFFKKIRQNRLGLFVGALMVVLGFVMNRLNVSITGMLRGSQTSYFPSFLEIMVTVMIVALGFVIFSQAVRFFPIFAPSQERSQAAFEPGSLKQPALGPLTSHARSRD
ncbi:MAG: Ni/Fe-hydrogenase cytochrome b subunit [Acidobacteriia bacterium]|nr:Ni/Fe-hydrogenase cytochrome b subunit [Terriglobia bacterium]